MTVAFVARIAGLLVFGTLLCSGATHLRHSASFGAALTAQGIHSLTVRRLVTSVVTACELAIGATGLTAGAVAWLVGLRVTAIAAMLLNAAFACYTWVLIRRRPGAPCGCGHRLEPATIGTVTRAAALSLMATLPLLARPPSSGGSPTYTALAVLCAAGLGIALWQVPSATMAMQP